MIQTTTNQLNWNYTDTMHFDGIPCQVIEETHIILAKQGETTREFVDKFSFLTEAGIEVHSGHYS